MQINIIQKKLPERLILALWEIQIVLSFKIKLKFWLEKYLRLGCSQKYNQSLPKPYKTLYT